MSIGIFLGLLINLLVAALSSALLIITSVLFSVISSIVSITLSGVSNKSITLLFLLLSLNVQKNLLPSILKPTHIKILIIKLNPVTFLLKMVLHS